MANDVIGSFELTMWATNAVRPTGCPSEINPVYAANRQGILLGELHH